MKLLPLTLLLALSCACLPKQDDNSPPWPTANRMSLEQTVSCNTAQESLGIAGCAFIGVPDKVSTLQIPPVYYSRLAFTSIGCSSKEFLSENRPTTIKLADLYDSPNSTSCSFAISRYVYDQKRKHRLDLPQVGRFFIKVIPENKYHALAKFSVINENFTGVGWYKHPFSLSYPPVTFHPQGTKGTLLIKCGQEDTLVQEYTSNEVTIPMPTKECDYEIALVNDDSPMIEFGTLVVMNEQYTEDIKLPLVSIRGSSTTFTFPEVNSKGKSSVVGVQVEDKVCANTPKCSYPTRSRYTVRAVTSNMRYFKGIYDSSSQQWRIIR